MKIFWKDLICTMILGVILMLTPVFVNYLSKY